MIYYKEVAHLIMEMVNPKINRVNWQTRNPE